MGLETLEFMNLSCVHLGFIINVCLNMAAHQNDVPVKLKLTVEIRLDSLRYAGSRETARQT